MHTIKKNKKNHWTHFTKFFFALSLFNATLFANCPKDIYFATYKKEPHKLTHEMIQSHKYQEAIWLLFKNNKQEKARALQKTLEDHMEDVKIDLQKDIIKKLGGATRPLLINLQCGIKGVFKSKQMHPSSNYKSEIAAYKLSKLFKLNLVPVTIAKKIKHQKGSLQYFVANTKSADSELGYIKSNKLNIFDYIIRNKDRNMDNILLLDGKDVAIDHGLSFRKYNLLGNILNTLDSIKSSLNYKTDPVRSLVLHPKVYPNLFIADEQTMHKIQNISYLELEKCLQQILKRKQIKMVYHKIQKLKNYLKLNNPKD